MNLKRLFTVSLAAALGMGMASADQYIIKDGMLADGIEVLKYTEKSPGDLFEEGVTAPDGTTAAKITHKVVYNDVRFYKDAAFDLNEDWNLVIEFYYVAGTMHDTLAGQKWPALDLGLVDDTTGGKYTSADANVLIHRDIKFKDAGDQWNKENMYVYSQPSFTSEKLLTFGWQRQVKPGDADDTRAVYIKNMYFTHEGNKPFFADNFEHATAFYSEVQGDAQAYTIAKVDYSKKGTVIDPKGSVTPTGNLDVEKYMTSQLPIYSEKQKPAFASVNFRRLYEISGHDSSDYYDCDVLHALEILGSNTEDSRDGRTFYFIPMAGLEKMTSFNVDFISKWDAFYSDQELTAETPDEDRTMKIGYMYVDAPADVIDLEATPFADTMLIQGMWSPYHYANVPVDATKKYLALCFESNENYCYVVDEIRLTANNLTFSSVTMDADASNNGVASYSMVESSSVESIKASEALTIYPNPATSVVTVANEGVNSVAVYSLAGNVVAQVNGNSVNVSSLAKGIYVVKAYTNEGVIVGSIIKK